MKTAQFALVGVITVAAVGGAWYAVVSQAPQETVERPALFPDLVASVNDISRVSVKDGDNQVSLARTDDGWRVTTSGGYPATVDTLRRTLSNIAMLRILEPKTAKPELYSRIGVEDVVPGANSVQITLGAADTVIADVIIGNLKERGDNQVPGFYVRRASESQAYLVEGDLDVSARERDWLDSNVFDVPVDDVHAVTISHPGTEPYVVQRGGELDDDFALLDVPRGYEVQSQAIVTGLGTGLANVNFDQVAKLAELEWPDEVITASYSLFDGTQYLASTATVDDVTYTHFEVSFDASRAVSLDVEDGDAEGNSAGATDLAAAAEALNASLAPWAYVLPDFKLKTMVRTLDDLLRETSDGASDPNAE